MGKVRQGEAIICPKCNLAFHSKQEYKRHKCKKLCPHCGENPAVTSRGLCRSCAAADEVVTPWTI